MDFEFSWMTYFVSLFALMGLSLALTWLCRAGGKAGEQPPAGAADERKRSAH